MSNPRILSMMLDYLEASNAVTKVAQELVSKGQEKKASADQIETVVDELVATGLATTKQADYARKQLSSPDTAMAVLMNVVQSYKQATAEPKKAQELGRPEAPVKQSEAKKSSRDESLLRLIGR